MTFCASKGQDLCKKYLTIIFHIDKFKSIGHISPINFVAVKILIYLLPLHHYSFYGSINPRLWRNS